MFKHTGIVRRIDDIGRIVIPKEVRRRFRINDGDPIEIGEDGEFIALRKYSVVELGGDMTQRLLHCFTRTTSKPVILCSTSHVLHSLRVTINAPEYLTTELCEALRTEDKSCLGYEITADSGIKVAALEKIYVGNSFEGVLIIPETDLNKEVTDADKECLKLCANAITTFLE